MKYKAILFDMDGTLLPMDQKEFIEGYFKLLGEDLKEYIDYDLLVKALWHGTYAMYKNDGTKTNRELFWDDFIKLTNLNREVVEPICDNFYSNRFKIAQEFTKNNNLAKKCLYLAHQKADIVVLATNPLFPLVAQKTRLSFVDLKEDDFDYITAYEDQCFTKPNKKYYEEILNRFNLKPNECLMVGNDVNEDMKPCIDLGIDTYLVTDCLIDSDTFKYEGKKGNFKELLEYLGGLE